MNDNDVQRNARIKTALISDFSISVEMTWGGDSLWAEKCPFEPNPHFHGVVIKTCPFTGGNIKEERERKKELAERTARADKAEADYREAHLKGWRNVWRLALGVGGALALFTVGFLAGFYHDGLLPFWYADLVAVIALGWLLLWVWLNGKKINSEIARAKAVRERILRGEA